MEQQAEERVELRRVPPIGWGDRDHSHVVEEPRDIRDHNGALHMECVDRLPVRQHVRRGRKTRAEHGQDPWQQREGAEEGH